MTKVRLGNVHYDSYAEVAKEAGIPYMTFYQRLRTGWTPREAASTPVRKYTATQWTAKKAKKVKAKAKAKRKAAPAPVEQIAA